MSGTDIPIVMTDPDIAVRRPCTGRARRQHPEVGAELSRRYRSWNRRGLINTVRSVLVDRDSSLDALVNVQAPALLVSGKEDTILPSPHSRRILGKLPKGRHIEVAGAAHLVPLEAPETANKLILDFVADLPRKTN